jgi:hypothetical protein
MVKTVHDTNTLSPDLMRQVAPALLLEWASMWSITQLRVPSVTPGFAALILALSLAPMVLALLVYSRRLPWVRICRRSPWSPLEDGTSKPSLPLLPGQRMRCPCVLRQGLRWSSRQRPPLPVRVRTKCRASASPGSLAGISHITPTRRGGERTAPRDVEFHCRQTDSLCANP